MGEMRRGNSSIPRLISPEVEEEEKKKGIVDDAHFRVLGRRKGRAEGGSSCPALEKEKEEEKHTPLER